MSAAPTENHEAARAVILAVDDEPSVARAVERDLRRRYGRDFRVLRAESGAQALEAVRESKLRGASIAMLVADQRMPVMSGVEFLEQAIELAPEAKRVLLTAYADTQAAIDAINRVALDHYLLKPWDPPEEQLYPVVDDLLDEWRADAPQPSDRIRVVGHRWSRESHDARDFLARNQVPYSWLDIERDDEGQRLRRSLGNGTCRAAAGAVSRRRIAAGAHHLRARRARRGAAPRRAAVLRPGDRRRRPRRPGGRGVRRVRGAHDRADRARGAGRPGGPELAHRELPGLPVGPQRRRPGAARDGAGHAVRRRAALRPGGHGHRRARPGEDRARWRTATRSARLR